MTSANKRVIFVGIESTTKHIHILTIAAHVSELVASLTRHLIDPSSDDVGADGAPNVTIVGEPGASRGILPALPIFRHSNLVPKAFTNSYHSHQQLNVPNRSSCGYNAEAVSAARGGSADQTPNRISRKRHPDASRARVLLVSSTGGPIGVDALLPR